MDAPNGQDPNNSNDPNTSGSSKPAGTTMLTLAWVSGLILLTALFSEFISRRENPNQTPISSSIDGVNEVVLKKNPQHHYITTGYINNKPVDFLVDTGATRVAIPPTLAKNLGLVPGREGFAITANGTTTTRDTMIQSLRIGSIHLTDVKASITYGMEGDGILLGMSALKDIEFTHRDGILTLRQY